MRVTASILSAFFLAILLVSPAPSYSQKDRPAQFVIDDAIHFEASVPEIEPIVTPDLALIADLNTSLSIAKEHVKCGHAVASRHHEALPRLHLKLRVFRN